MVVKLTREQLFTLAKAAEIRWASATIYGLDAASQRKVWMFEVSRAHATGDLALNQDQWLVNVVEMMDAVQPSAPIYLLDDALEVAEHAEEAVVDKTARIVMWRDIVSFYGNGACVPYFAGTSKYTPFLDRPWTRVALGMWAVSWRPATTRPIGTTERHTLHRAKYQPRRDFYYVQNIRHDPAPRREPKGGHHASPVAHDRSAHKALLTRVSLESEQEVQDLRARQYTVQVTEELPPEVADRMLRRGKQPVPGALNAYRWIDKSAARVNPDGESARRVTLIR